MIGKSNNEISSFTSFENVIIIKKIKFIQKQRLYGFDFQGNEDMRSA